ncbi:MAG: endonuclease III [Oscillospiraceae bacterium]|jgi:endonuclease-3|nr:endonuclease III [Oscillospiraceae bacterium]
MTITEICKKFKTLYPERIKCMLNYTEPWQLLVSARLSAQCTDKRVNMVTPRLFAEYPTVTALAVADVVAVAEIIKSCGLYKTKAEQIVAMCAEIVTGGIPDTIDGLTTLSGIGRKTANLFAGEIYGLPCVVCDTHLLRITRRLALIGTDNPIIAEKALAKQLTDSGLYADGLWFSHCMVTFGRTICTARNPKCGMCVFADKCKGG